MMRYTPLFFGYWLWVLIFALLLLAASIYDLWWPPLVRAFRRLVQPAPDTSDAAIGSGGESEGPMVGHA